MQDAVCDIIESDVASRAPELFDVDAGMTSHAVQMRQLARLLAKLIRAGEAARFARQQEVAASDWIT